MNQSAPFNIEEASIQNKDLRRVLDTTTQSQLVLMSLKPGESIGTEAHRDLTQFFRIESGIALIELGSYPGGSISRRFEVRDGGALLVHPDIQHNITNIGEDDLKLYTLYSPPNHPLGLVQKHKP